MATPSVLGPPGGSTSGAGQGRGGRAGLSAGLSWPATGYNTHPAPSPRHRLQGTDVMTQQLEHDHTDTDADTNAQPDALEDALEAEPRAGRLDDQIDDFRRRVIQEAMAHGTSCYWHRRAATFEWARPRPGDYLGTAGEERARVLDERLVATRDACRQRATLAELNELY